MGNAVTHAPYAASGDFVVTLDECFVLFRELGCGFTDDEDIVDHGFLVRVSAMNSLFEMPFT